MIVPVKPSCELVELALERLLDRRDRSPDERDIALHAQVVIGEPGIPAPNGLTSQILIGEAEGIQHEETVFPIRVERRVADDRKRPVRCEGRRILAAAVQRHDQRQAEPAVLLEGALVPVVPADWRKELEFPHDPFVHDLVRHDAARSRAATN